MIMWTNYRRLFNGLRVNTVICVAYKSHYESLNIHKNATHKEIKDAYYRLSMIYHPDKNKGCEKAAKMFRDITSAYEVLGNVRQRKLYDSGANINQMTPRHTTTQKPFETMNTKRDVCKSNFSNRDYNFDQWSRTHYTNVFQRQHSSKESITKKKFNEDFIVQQNSYSFLVIMIIVSVFVMSIMFEYVKETTRKSQDILSLKKTGKDF